MRTVVVERPVPFALCIDAPGASAVSVSYQAGDLVESVPTAGDARRSMRWYLVLAALSVPFLATGIGPLGFLGFVGCGYGLAMAAVDSVAVRRDLSPAYRLPLRWYAGRLVAALLTACRMPGRVQGALRGAVDGYRAAAPAPAHTLRIAHQPAPEVAL
jgi:hypothetical protein